MILYMNLWIRRLVHLLFSYIFNRANIFSFTDFLPKIFTSPDTLWWCLSNQGCYFEIYFYQKSLNPPSIFCIQLLILFWVVLMVRIY